MKKSLRWFIFALFAALAIWGLVRVPWPAKAEVTVVNPNSQTHTPILPPSIKIPTIFPSDSHRKNENVANEPYWQQTNGAANEADQLLMDEVSFLFRDYRLALSQLPTGTNAEITAALLGNNLRQLRLTIPEKCHVNAVGELCDAWQTPYFFHSISATHLDIRSAGPDRVMGNADDLSAQSQ